MNSRWLVVVVLVLALLFALEGGEYSTQAWLKLRREERLEAERVQELRRIVDSLEQLAKKIENDPETQERIAREKHGMLKPGEHAFRFTEARER